MIAQRYAPAVIGVTEQDTSSNTGISQAIYLDTTSSKVIFKKVT